MVSLYKDPNGENIFTKTHRTGSGPQTSQLTPASGEKTEIILTLQRRVSELEDIVSSQAIINKVNNKVGLSSGTPLSWTPLGNEILSFMERCP